MDSGRALAAGIHPASRASRREAAAIGGSLAAAAVVLRGGGYVSMSFAHLHVHTQYSLLDGANKIEPLLEHAKLLGHVRDGDHRPWQHVWRGRVFQQSHRTRDQTDHRMRGLRRARQAHRSLALPKGDDFDGGGNFHLILLAESRTGYRNLCRLLSAAYREGLYYKPRIDKEILTEHSRGPHRALGMPVGEMVARWLRAGRIDKAREVAESYARMFPGPLLPRTAGQPAARPLNDALREIGRTTGLPMVATNDCHYLHRDDARAHEVLLCIQTGKTLADEIALAVRYRRALRQDARRDGNRHSARSPKQSATRWRSRDGSTSSSSSASSIFRYYSGRAARRIVDQVLGSAREGGAWRAPCGVALRAAATSTRRPTTSVSTASCRSSARWAFRATC